MKNEIIITGVAITTIGVIYLYSKRAKKNQNKRYIYDINPIVTDCKHWGYVLRNDEYEVKLNKGDSIVINQTTTIATDSPIANGYIDTLFHNFYHPCNPNNSQSISVGYFTVKIDGTIVDRPPHYIAYPACPKFGTITQFLWNGQDSQRTGLVTYEYIWQGNEPITLKTIEYYIVVYHGG